MEPFPKRIMEGKVVLVLPSNHTSNQTPGLDEVFYNPNAKVVRDLSIIVCETFARQTGGYVKMADGMCGVGARGIRVAAEAPGVHEVHLNDIHELSVKAAIMAAKENGVAEKCKFSNDEVCRFLISHATRGGRFEIVDIDPYGTPAPYLDCALRPVRDGGLAGITSTDTAVLCGVYPRVAYRRYGGYSLRGEIGRELGIRLLLSSLAHQGGRMDLGLDPLFSLFMRNHVRIYARVRTSASLADRNLDSMGYVLECNACGSRSTTKGESKSCERCGGRETRVAGPLWVGPIHSKDFLRSCLSISEEMGPYLKSARKILEVAHGEEDILGYFDLDRVTRKIGLMSLSMTKVIDLLREHGYRASRSSIEPKGIKTNASYDEFLSLVKTSFPRP